jgi:hypothetical protein
MVCRWGSSCWGSRGSTVFAELLRVSPGMGKLTAATASKDRIKQRAAVCRGDFIAI